MLRPGAWRAVPSQRVPWVLGRRLECLQRIVSKLQMEAGLCEEQLNQADALLQSVRGRGRGGTGQRQQGGGVGRGGSLKLPLLAGGSQLLPPGAQPALTDCWLRAEQSRLVGTRQDTREACPRARCLDGRGEDEAQGPWGRPGSGFSAPGSHGWHFVHLEDMWGWVERGRERSGPGSESQPTL